jgi:translation initiation factor 4E
MVRPREIPTEYGFSIFQEGIKPAWEDKANLNGGRFILRIKKQYSNFFWETLILAFVKEQNDLMCGITSNCES